MAGRIDVVGVDATGCDALGRVTLVHAELLVLVGALLLQTGKDLRSASFHLLNKHVDLKYGECGR